MKYCAACCMAKNEDFFLKEWIAYHRILGFEHFIIYDDNSTISIEILLGGWIQSNIITVIKIDNYKHQNDIYNHCIKNFGSKFRWIAFLDVDEFIRISHKNKRLRDIRCFLAEFEPYAGLGINWRMYSWNGHEKTPASTVIESYSACLGDNIHIKSIIQPSKIDKTATPHSFYTNSGEFVVNPEHFPVSNGIPFSIPKTDSIAINHYYYKSRECFFRKIKKGNPVKIPRNIEQFERHVSMPTQKDESLFPFVNAVKSLISNGIYNFDEEKNTLNDFAQILLLQDSISFDSKAHHEIEKMLICLSKMTVEQNTQLSDKDIKSSIWVLRTKAALALNDTELAKSYIKQAIIYCEDIEILKTLVEYYRKVGDPHSLKHSIEIIHVFLNRLK